MTFELSKAWEAVSFSAMAHGEKLLWGTIGWISKAAWSHRKRLINATVCSTFFYFCRIRISASGLVRISFDNKFLLVRGNRIKTQFQPVGGVYKYNARGLSELEKLQFRIDSAIKVDDTSRDDLRINVPGRYVPTLLKWFDNRIGRECDPWREFYEELIVPGVLSGSEFPYVQFNTIKRKETYIHWSPELKTWEILIADIFDLALTPAQETAFRALLNRKSEKYKWFTRNQIEDEGIENGKDTAFRISKTSRWLLN